MRDVAEDGATGGREGRRFSGVVHVVWWTRAGMMTCGSVVLRVVRVQIEF